MYRIRFARLLAIMLGFSVVGSALFPSAAFGSRTAVVRHHLDLRAGVPAFTFGHMPGFNPTPAGTVVIYGDGKVESRGRIQRASIARLSVTQLQSLLQVADRKGFFRLPARIAADEPMPDRGSAFITIHTTARDKTVTKDAGATSRTFDQIFARLYAAVTRHQP